MFNWLFNYWTVDDIEKAIDKIDNIRKKKRILGQTLKSSFSEDLKDLINGVYVVEDEEKENDKENIKINIEEKKTKM